MLPKPSGCEGCPMYQDGVGFVPDFVRGNPVGLIAQNPGADEERGMRVVGYQGRDPLYERTDPLPLIGKSGFFLKQKVFPLAGLHEDGVDYYNILKCRWRHSNELPTGDIYEQAVQHCTTAHLQIHPSHRLLIAHGAHAWEWSQRAAITQWQATQPKRAWKNHPYKITDWRGFLGPDHICGRPVYGTLHTADLFRDAHARFINRFDWKRVARIQAQQWPEVVPRSVLAGPTTRSDFVAILEEALVQPEIMVDTEFDPKNKFLTMVGAAWKHRIGNPDTGEVDWTVRGFQLEWVNGRATSIERAIFLQRWPELCQNVTMCFWNAKADLPVLQQNLGSIPEYYEDPMQAHAVLWPDMEHSYEFVASIYGKYNKLKHLKDIDPILYHWGDMIDLVWIWEALKDEFIQDPQAERKYREQNLKLLPIFMERETLGIRVNQARIEQAIPEYQVLSRQASTLAQAYCGFPVNLGSSVQLVSYLQHGEALSITSMDKNVVAQARAKFLPFDANREEKTGFSVEYVQQRVQDGAHPLLELRVMYAQNDTTVMHYLNPLRGVSRCYPNFNCHTQAAGRHSITDPPLATLPDRLRDIVCPDPGTVWIGWDWSQQEPRIQAAESGSHVLQTAFEQGVDIHTQLVCLLYRWEFPPDLRDPHSATVNADWRQTHAWGGSEDKRRRFAKELRYELNYSSGGSGHHACEKAIRMGIEPHIVKRAVQVFLDSDPELAEWFRAIQREAEQTKIARSWDGGRRVFFWWDFMAKNALNEARNFPLQGGGAGLNNLTMVEIAEKVPGAKYVYDMHDSQWWECGEHGWKQVYGAIRPIVEQLRSINGRLTPFPASFKVMFEDGRVEKL